jgi:two-component system chemotaxis response regulator CheB
VIRLRREGPTSLYPGVIDALLVSLSELCGPAVFTALLTGDGKDGVKGCKAVAEAGGRFVVQDEASSLAWELPGAAARTGLADRLVPLADMADCIARAAGYRA